MSTPRGTAHVEGGAGGSGDPAPPGEAQVTQDDWARAQDGVRRQKLLTMLVAALVLPAMSLPALLLADLSASGPGRDIAVVGWAAALLLPLEYLVLRISLAQQARTDAMIGALTDRLSEAVETAGEEAGEREVQARRQRFESRLANALDMADGEPEVIDVIERSFAATLPDSPVELLLADNSHAHLLRMASSAPAGVAPGCSVDSPDHCPAARRAQVQRFDDSNALDACPKLRGRQEGSVAALCVPVAIMGRTVGVIHAVADEAETLAREGAGDLETLAKLGGARLGMLRIMAESQLQAATDSLTGMLNRRSFEVRVSAMRREGVGLSLALADLDHFKTLNDMYGHETGDRALRLFTQVVTESVRSQDVVGRHGGEEFVVALPGCPLGRAGDILEALRAKLDAAITVAGLPRFTVSFGLVEASPREGLPVVIGRADAALFEAKRAGRNQVVVHDAAGAAVERNRPAPDLATGAR